MRVMVIVKASPQSESGQLPSRELLAEMSRFNEELLKAGVMLSGEGLHASSRGVRVKFDAGRGTVTDGLIAGYWLWQVRSVEEAVEWIRRSPFKHGSEEVEIRPVLEAEDFTNLTPELKAQEARQRERLERR
jgi:hypothetical protein